jgi:hypothetical protein
MGYKRLWNKLGGEWLKLPICPNCRKLQCVFALAFKLFRLVQISQDVEGWLMHRLYLSMPILHKCMQLGITMSNKLDICILKVIEKS